MEEQKVQKKIPVKSSVCLSDFVKNGCELVNVASLLAEKRKVKSKEKNQ